jgi:hypothetical protein
MTEKMETRMADMIPPGWMPLSLLSNRFNANLDALATRAADLANALRTLTPAEPYFVRTTSSRIDLAIGTGERFRVLPATLGAAAAPAIARHLCPNAVLTQPVLIAGDDQGWLWNQVCQYPTDIKRAPGHRSPVYLLTDNPEKFWVWLHLHDWQQLLADPRVRLFVGTGCADQLERSLLAESLVPRPGVSITIDPSVWTGDRKLAAILESVMQKHNVQLNRLAATDPVRGAGILERFGAGSPLRVMGITSRYTTYIQHSVRDWLAAFESLGHTTGLLIETADHQIPNNLATAAAVDRFRPDLIVAVDHTRKSLSGVPAHIPVVMWVQDRLANIYDPAAGESQGPLDFVLGYGRLELTQKFNYPPSRFMPAVMATNERRFTDTPRPAAELDRFRCDVSYVSHASASAEAIVARAKAKLPQQGARDLIDDLYGQMHAIYDAGGAVSSGDVMLAMIRQTLADRRQRVEEAGVFDLVAHQLNNAMFRHQALQWVAESGADLRLYGRGWEKHPTLAKFARGEADHVADLQAIYQASAINLQVTPFGAVHQRLLDGLAAGGFFLMRSVTADELELLRKAMWDWCVSRGIDNGRDMFVRRDAEWLAVAEKYAALGATDPRANPEAVFAELEECAFSGFTRTPETLFADAGAVTFSGREELIAKMGRFLKSPQERGVIASSMRERVLQTHTYRGITQRLVEFVRNDLSRTKQNERRAA